MAGLFLGLQIAKGVWNFVSLFKKGGTLRNAFAKDGWLRKAFGKKGWIGKGLSRLTKGLKNIGKKLGGKDGLFSKAWKGIKSGSKGIFEHTLSSSVVCSQSIVTRIESGYRDSGTDIIENFHLTSNLL